MTGEMHASEVIRENFPLHFAIAAALGGEVKPFDQYQGPYILTKGACLWLCTDHDQGPSEFATIYNEATKQSSAEFPLWGPDEVELAIGAARSVI